MEEGSGHTRRWIYISTTPFNYILAIISSLMKTLRGLVELGWYVAYLVRKGESEFDLVGHSIGIASSLQRPSNYCRRLSSRGNLQET